MKNLFVVSALLLVAGTFNVVAEGPDTPETRRSQAERYMQSTPPKEMFADMAEKMAANLPPEQRASFKASITSDLDISALTTAMLNSMVKHFTTEELKALADFYSSPIGKSAMKKFGDYMADVMPAIQAEMTKAMMKTRSSSPADAPPH